MQIACIDAFLDEKLDDALMQVLLLGRIHDASRNLLCDQPEVSLLCGFTDNFQAQARVNRLALQFGVPSLSAQVYKEGRGLEITFTHPEYTEACHRCVLSKRYSAFGNGYQPDVGSHGTPIFATARLNAIKGMIALALLHAGTGHKRWTALLEGMRNRNLVQVRFDPNIETELGLKVFNRTFGRADQNRLLFDETVWLPQKAEHPRNGQPICPDCLGTGNLRQRTGAIADTTSFLSAPTKSDRGIWRALRQRFQGHLYVRKPIMRALGGLLTGLEGLVWVLERTASRLLNGLLHFLERIHRAITNAIRRVIDYIRRLVIAIARLAFALVKLALLYSPSIIGLISSDMRWLMFGIGYALIITVIGLAYRTRPPCG